MAKRKRPVRSRTARGRAAPAVPKKPTPHQKAAITRATSALVSLGAPKPSWRRAKRELYDRRVEQFRGTLARAGSSPRSIAARLGAITRQVAPPKTKARGASQEPSPQQKAAITRAGSALSGLGQPRTWWRQAQKDLYERRLDQFRAVLERAGFSPRSIAARLGQLTRSRQALREQIADVRLGALGTERLDTKNKRTGLYLERGRNQILRNMVRTRDRRYVRYLETVQREFGLTEAEAENEWFSPKVVA